MWQLNSETNSEEACSCSHSKYTDRLLNYILRYLDFSKDFTEKMGLLYSYITLFISYYSFTLGLILMQFNTSVVKRRPPV